MLAQLVVESARIRQSEFIRGDFKLKQLLVIYFVFSLLFNSPGERFLWLYKQHPQPFLLRHNRP